ncbi:hypothetical protein AArcSl_0656 [Halalkaliarchaeum desulfuricum]|uniref:DUF7344 domain-containing protein n=1 Tax=Halalkaliarchaeum desulfuricum TaxID=2055893 RepID=A0A343TGT4_9EURY|nr:hypothetical protein [Halalkaliarchaeum desulfuricum]AUX08306.1 hypothetical protein AArcSl_0656 [Halalkaliarchaeum desulfuricum]
MTVLDQAHGIPIDPDDAFHVMSNSRRRQVLLSLSQSEEPQTASELAREIAAIENLVAPSEVTGEQRTTVYVALIQSHLEMMDDLGVVDYDERGKRVEATEATKPVANHIREITSACYDPEGSE